jgi:zinc protease
VTLHSSAKIIQADEKENITLMIDFKRFCLNNGLKILVHEDTSTPLVSMNILYDVGSKDEDPELTGIAHLFEHLMFSGSENIPDFDTPLQLAGGENNAFTNNDITNYYLTIPAENIETAFWLESDRMSGLNFSENNLDIQKKVVIEEFKQRYLNQPYGDIMLNLRPLAYKVHPYLWPTIGKEISHIEKVKLDRIREFFFSHYAPNNAIMAITGNIKPEKAFELADRWFGPLERRKINPRLLPSEPLQPEERSLTMEKEVPSDMLYKAWHVCKRVSKDFYILDLFTDILAGGESGWLYSSLVREKKLFSDINAYLGGEIDPGLLIISGKLMKGVSIYEAEDEILKIIENMKKELIPDTEMEKVKNKFEASMVFSNTSIINKSMSLSSYELLGDADAINKEIDIYRGITAGTVIETVNKYMSQSNCSTVYYKSVNKTR